MIKPRIHSKKYYVSALLIIILIPLLFITACAPDQAEPTTTELPLSGEQEIPGSPLPPKDTAPPDPTPTPTLSPLPALTATPMPYTMITGNTNCRFGPGSVYALLHTYLAGDQAQLLGKSPDGTFWYIRDQAGLVPDCWLWGKYATPVGDTSLLPVFTPPPTPTPRPDYEITYDHADVAAGGWWLFFKIENTGSITWESALLYIYDPTASEGAGSFYNSFLKFGSPGEIVSASIPVGGTGYVHSGQIGNPYFNPGGGKIHVYIVVCEEDNLGGVCQGKEFTIDA